MAWNYGLSKRLPWLRFWSSFEFPSWTTLLSWPLAPSEGTAATLGDTLQDQQSERLNRLVPSDGRPRVLKCSLAGSSCPTRNVPVDRAGAERKRGRRCLRMRRTAPVTPKYEMTADIADRLMSQQPLDNSSNLSDVVRPQIRAQHSPTRRTRKRPSRAIIQGTRRARGQDFSAEESSGKYFCAFCEYISSIKMHRNGNAEHTYTDL